MDSGFGVGESLFEDRVQDAPSDGNVGLVSCKTESYGRSKKAEYTPAADGCQRLAPPGVVDSKAFRLYSFQPVRTGPELIGRMKKSGEPEV